MCGVIGEKVRADDAIAGPQRGDACRGDTDSDFPGAEGPVGNGLPGGILVDVFPVEDGTDGTEASRARDEIQLICFAR